MDASREKLYVWLTFIVYIMLVSFMAFHHVPWRDEAQAWLIARDCNFVGMYHQLGYEGTPGLWHLLLFPFAQLGFPNISIQIIHALLAAGAVYVFLFYAPFPLLFRIPFVFSYYIAYEYAVIARSYVLTVLLLFVIATQYSKRFTHPFRYSILVFLLFQTNIHSCFIAASLLLAYCVETQYQRNKCRMHNAPFDMVRPLMVRQAHHIGLPKGHHDQEKKALRVTECRMKKDKAPYYMAVIIMVLGAVLAYMQVLLPSDTIHPGLVNGWRPDIIFEAVQHAVLS